MGAKLPRGVLLEGAPGTGKTMLARAVATESNVPFLYASCTEFVEIFVGEGSRRIRNLFSYAKSVAPALIFLDEMDAIGAARSNTDSNREHDQSLNQLLIEMDGFYRDDSVLLVVIAATNRVEVIDKALLRPGRFDKIISVPLPDSKSRYNILNHYLSEVQFGSELSEKQKEEHLKQFAMATAGLSGAELFNIVNEAALMAIRQNVSEVDVDILSVARDKVTVGPERTDVIMSEREREVTAFHEAGHALVAYFLQPYVNPVSKVSIVPRGNSLGYVEHPPTRDQFTYTLAEAKAQLCVAMGGRIAEEIVFGWNQVSSGAISDLKFATSLARKMVVEWGMSKKFGLFSHAQRKEYVSESMTSEIETEVRAILEEAVQTATNIINSNRKHLNEIANQLLQNGNMSGQELTNIIEGTSQHYRKINRKKQNSPLYYGGQLQSP